MQRSTGLTQIIKIPTRENVTLDWCFTNRGDNIYKSVQLPPLGSSDHNMVCLKSRKNPPKLNNKKLWKRDLRESSLRPFGRWITSFDWSDIFATSLCEDKYEKFNGIMKQMIDIFFPLKLSKLVSCDKPWLTPSLRK